ncbi:MAG TPA: protein kinase, partial [Myxococcota bacterium]|nr:protein kinase [Myxococcota bacterium]
MPELQREEFGRYLLLTRLDAGGMAEIFLARPVNPTAEHPLVVVKRILPDLARDPDMLRMFVDEARLSQHLVHPHIVRTLDLGRVGQRPYLVMELLRGESLGQVLRASVKAGLWPGHALAADLVRQAALGLEHAHNACDGQG